MFSSRRAGGQGFTGGYNGNATQSQLTENKSVASVAQLVEQLTLNQLVEGSNPPGVTSINMRASRFLL